MASIGERIKEARTLQHLTQQDLANKLMVSRSAVSNWEVGRNYPDLDLIVLIGDVLNLSLDQLLREDTVMVKEVSKEQKNNKKRKMILRIIVPLFIVSLITIGYLLYQEVGNVHNQFSPSVTEVIEIDNDDQSRQLSFRGKEFLNFDNMFWNREIISDANNPETIDVIIFNETGKNKVSSFSLKPGEGKTLEDLSRKKNYIIKVNADPGTYSINFY